MDISENFNGLMMLDNKVVGRWNWLLAFLVIFSVVGIFCAFIYFWIGHYSQFKDGMSYAGQYGDSFGALNSLFSGLGFSVLIVTLLYQQSQIKIQSIKDNYEVEERRSLFNLTAWEDAKLKAMNLLSDGNNNRATWIRAARVIRMAEGLATGVTIENHRHVMELKSLEHRGFFRALLENKSAAFFYGADDPSVSVASAAAQSTVATEDNGRHIFGNSVLSESSIYEIVRAAEWPENYQDPIGVNFPENFERQLFSYNGLREFLYHKRSWYSIAGNLHRRSSSDLD